MFPAIIPKPRFRFLLSLSKWYFYRCDGVSSQIFFTTVSNLILTWLPSLIHFVTLQQFLALFEQCTTLKRNYTSADLLNYQTFKIALKHSFFLQGRDSGARGPELHQLRRRPVQGVGASGTE